MKTVMFGGLLASLALVGCGGTTVSMDDVNGANANGAVFAIFEDTVESADFDGDGVEDFDFSNLAIIISDQEDLCGQLEADPDALVNLADIQSVQIAAFKVDNVG